MRVLPYELGIPHEVQLQAEQLLLEHLSSGQRFALVARGYFGVRGSDGTMYRIRAKRKRNVVCSSVFGSTSDGYWVEFEQRVGCLPLGDLLLAQKMLLETDAGAYKMRSC